MTTNPTSSAETLSMSQQQMLTSVQNLQEAQKDLMNKFASASSQDERQNIVDEMNKNEALRTSILSSIGSASLVSNQNIVNKTNQLNTKIVLLQVANDELNATRKAIEEMQRARAEKERAIEINTYYGKRFAAQAGVMKIFIYMCIPVLVLAILANMGFVPNYISGFLIIAIIVIGVVYIYNAVSDISRRDDMNFDEYKWDFDPSRVGPLDHPHRHHKKKPSSSDMCDVQGDKSAVKGTSQVVGKVGAVSIANTAAPTTPAAPSQVFAVGPGYDYTQCQAPEVCAKYGAQVATTAQLQDAQNRGADWCFTGWVSDSNNAMYPITTSTMGGCGNGRSGVITWTPGNNRAGVNCYGPKPGVNDYSNTILPFNQSVWSQNEGLLGDLTKKPSVRQLLDSKCPMSISETRNGVVYIVEQNEATRNNYLFSGCTDANTCDTVNPDPVSKNLIDNIGAPPQHCGSWAIGNYTLDNGSGKWIKN